MSSTKGKSNEARSDRSRCPAGDHQTVPRTHPVSMQGSYEALAHLFVGGVIGAWLVTRARWLLAIAIGLTAVEVGSAVIGLVL